MGRLLLALTAASLPQMVAKASGRSRAGSLLRASRTGLGSSLAGRPQVGCCRESATLEPRVIWKCLERAMS